MERAMKLEACVLCVVLFVLSAGCGSAAAPTLTRRGSAPCLPGSGAVETWCDDVGNCEFRVTTGGVFPCRSVESAECTDAATAAVNACVAGGVDGGVGGDGGVGTDGGSGGGVDAGPLAPVNELDLLLMIDDSNSMAEEQASIVTELPRLLEILTSGDRDGDGAPDFAPAASLHVGVVSSDMGVGAVSGIESCPTATGDDGILQSRGATTTGCSPAASGIFEFFAGEDVGDLARRVGCVVALGTGGCGFEQQLEASLKAVSLAPAGDGTSPVSWTRAGYLPPTFLGDTTGHGGAGGANDGFLRPGGVLAVVLVTDEEDCSTTDTSIFDRTDPRFSSVDLNLRCHTFADVQYPVQRYVDGFSGLRADPRRLVFAAIAGVPPDASDAGLSYDALLDREEMVERIDPVLHNRLLPSCTSPGGRGVAYPPRRIVQVAQGLESLGAQTTVQSICSTSYSDAMDAIIMRISTALGH
jgi:hypothetical protein